MASQMATFFAKRFLGDRIGNYFKKDDPYFEATEDVPGGKKSRPRKKAIPPGLSERDAKVLKTVRKRAYNLDRSLTCCCCGFRFGWAAVIGIIPVIGDAINLLIALSIIRKCMEVDLPKHIVAQMYTNLAIDFGIGLVPLLGDFADAWYKSNTRNNILLEKFLRERGQKHPVAPPPSKEQSGLRRWFGPGTHAPGSHPGGQPVVQDTTSNAPTTAEIPTENYNQLPTLPHRNDPTTQYGSYDGIRAGGSGRERDLEAQQYYDDGAIHYRREE